MKRAKSVPKYGEKVVAFQNEYIHLTVDIEKNGVLNAARNLGVDTVADSPLSTVLSVASKHFLFIPHLLLSFRNISSKLKDTLDHDLTRA